MSEKNIMGTSVSVCLSCFSRGWSPRATGMGCQISYGVLNVHSRDCFYGGTQPFSILTRVFNVHGWWSLLYRGTQSAWSGSLFLCGYSTEVSEVSVPAGILNVHGLESLLLPVTQPARRGRRYSIGGTKLHDLELHQCNNELCDVAWWTSLECQCTLASTSFQSRCLVVAAVVLDLWLWMSSWAWIWLVSLSVAENEEASPKRASVDLWRIRISKMLPVEPEVVSKYCSNGSVYC
jgi:hypothetical protein